MVQWTQDDRCCKSGIHNVVCAGLLGDLRDLVEVGERQNGVGRRLAEDQLRVWPHRLPDVLWVGEVAECELHAQGCEEFPARPVCASIRALGDNTMVASFHGCRNRSRRGGHACAKGTGTEATLHCSELLLQYSDRG